MNQRHAPSQPITSRRTVLQAAAAGGLSLVWPGIGAAAPGSLSTADAAVIIFLKGGLSHLESFDPKPESSLCGAISTNVPGIRLADPWTETARIADKLTIIRSMTHRNAAHELAADSLLAELPAGREVGPGEIGRQLAVARRLIESGERVVNVTHGGWDLHADIARGLAERVPPFDRALASLIRGLDEAGRLDRTLVAVITEFGRSPRLNRDGGRDHWPGVFSVVLAGGGIPGGRVIGSSTQDGAEPKDRPVSPAMLAALIRHKVGVGLGPLPQLI